jgi:branched-chain amino acid aminotransferase
MTVGAVAGKNEDLRVAMATWRKDKESVLRGLKVGNYAEHLIALDQARREGFDEMLFFNTEDELCEAAMGNVFLIREGQLLTPNLNCGCLAGITRELILKIAREEVIPVKEVPLIIVDVETAEGMFLTSSVKGPVWVGQYGGVCYVAHPLFHRLKAAWLVEMGIS